MDGLLVSCFYTYSDSHGVWMDYLYLVSILTAIVHWCVDGLRVSCFYTYSDSHGVWIDYVYLVSISTPDICIGNHRHTANGIMGSAKVQ